MRKTLFLSLISLALLSSCASSPQQEGSQREVQRHVDAIYRHVLQVHNNATDKEVLSDSIAAFDSRYLSSEFSRLVVMVQHIDSVYHYADLDTYDFDHWLMLYRNTPWCHASHSVDSVSTIDTDHAVAHLTLTIDDNPMPVDLVMLREADGWRIADFVGQFPLAGSELATLKEYVDYEQSNPEP